MAVPDRLGSVVRCMRVLKKGFLFGKGGFWWYLSFEERFA